MKVSYLNQKRESSSVSSVFGFLYMRMNILWTLWTFSLSVWISWSYVFGRGPGYVTRMGNRETERKLLITLLFVSYIFVDASGWVISDVSFVFMGVGGSGLATLDSLSQMTHLVLILFQLPSRQLTCESTQGGEKMTTEKALYIILQWPIRAKLSWYLLNLYIKNREATLLGLVWFLCLMAYQLFLGYLMPKPFS